MLPVREKFSRVELSINARFHVGFEQGLELIEPAGAGGKLEDYYLFHAARADLLRRLERFGEAHSAYGRALALSTNRVEQNYIRRRLAELLWR